MGESGRRYPTVRLRELEEDYMKFDLMGTDLSVANALRRVMIAEVPTLAIELVDIEMNSSVLVDELLAHRLGLVPLLSRSAMKMKFARDCDLCDGDTVCPQCSVELRLDAVCTGDQNVCVTSNDLVVSPMHGCDVEPVSATRPGSSPITIAKLAENQQLRMRCIARKGIGKDHAKFSPASTVTFFAVPDIHINYDLANKLTLEQKQEFVESSPTDVFRINEDTCQIEVVDPELYSSYDEEVLKKVDELKVSGLVTVSPRENHFVFTVETTGVITAHELFFNAIQVLRTKLDVVRPSMDDDEQFGRI